MKPITSIIIWFASVVCSSVLIAAQDEERVPDDKPALQQTVQGAAKGVAKGVDNLVEGMKEMPAAIGKAANKLVGEDSKDSKDGENSED